MSASLALAGLNGCYKHPPETIVPYVQAPEYMVPGKPMYFATAMPFNGYGVGLLVESHQFRPTKVEGNPKHPSSLGAANAYAQASILDLYDPDRSQLVREGGQAGTKFSGFITGLEQFLTQNKGPGSVRLRILTDVITSPTFADQITGTILKLFPQAVWHQYQPVNDDGAIEGTRLAFGKPAMAVYRFDRAQRVVSLDSNFLLDEPGSVRYARDFVNARRVRPEPGAGHGNLAAAAPHADAPTPTPPTRRPPPTATPHPTTSPATAPATGPTTAAAAAGTQPHGHGGGGGALHREVLGAKPIKYADDAKTDASFLMNRLYVVESTASITGAMADHRQGLRARDVELFARALARELGVAAAAGGADAPMPKNFPDAAKWAAEIAKDLKSVPAGSTIIVPGRNQTPAVHALAHAMNVLLGNAGQTVVYTDRAEAQPALSGESIRELTDALRGNEVDALLILGGNPAYNAPGDLDFAAALQEFAAQGNGRAKFTAHLSDYYDETSFRCLWHVPRSHYLETWGDVRAHDGTVSIIQPLIGAIYATQSEIDVLSAVGSAALAAADALKAPVPDDVRKRVLANTSSYETVRAYWRGQPVAQGQNFEGFWQASLHDGLIKGTELKPITPAVAGNLSLPASPAGEDVGEEIVFRPDPTIFDGRYANNGWLQELPKPLSKLTWDNAAFLSFATAKRLGLKLDNPHEPQMISLKYAGRPEIRAAAWVQFGQPDDSVTVFLGYGRERAGRVGGENGEVRGFNAYKLMAADRPNFGSGLQVTVLDERYPLACTQDHQVIEDRRELVKTQDLLAYMPGADGEDTASGVHAGPENKSEEGEAAEGERGHGTVHLSLYPEYDYSRGHAWGMVIDTSACIGCNACVVACQAENNIPVVGKAEVGRSREMHWLRIDTYYGPKRADVEQSLDNPDVYFQPMLCQHCEQAPCEVVCPVAATSHSTEGINEMTYNRCVGTRYCSNNCPYKVRRFNFLQYQDTTTPSLKLMRNPNVTVRNRGVMEKCTYCVQRVNRTRIEEKKMTVNLDEAIARKDEKSARTYASELDALFADLQTACQQSCPTEAIVFGDINRYDAQGRPSEVARLRALPADVHFGVLTELNTRPRTTYLAKFRNPNPALRPNMRSSPAEAPRGAAAHG